jgi:hypothetical protein
MYQQGIRYHNRNIGLWKNWDRKGALTVTDYQHSDLIDSLQSIVF